MPNPVDKLEEILTSAGRDLDLSRSFQPRGIIRRVGDGVVFISGLEQVGYEELLLFDSGAYGMAYDIRENSVGSLILSGGVNLTAGEGVVALGQLPTIPVGEETLGRILDPLGNPLDDGPSLNTELRLPVFRTAPEIIERKSVDEPILTGVTMIDAAIPIGRGQRELIIGDRNTGKSALAIDIVSNQKQGDVACVYVSIGQPMSRVLALRETLIRAKCFENTAIIAADSSMSPGLQYLSAYAGASVAEYFRTAGRHALVVYDDLTKHADAYRELALLLERPPGREAFPGDIFSIHAELLERATALRKDAGGGSVTALPIIETTESDISAYIPTNLISITDGQIYLDTTRFERNQRPAIDIGRSVSRIGSAAQLKSIREASRNLRILMSRFEEVENLSRIGLDVDEKTMKTLRRGRLMRELLRQPRFAHRSPAEQILTLTAVQEGWLSELKIEEGRSAISDLLSAAQQEAPSLIEALNQGEMPEGWKEKFHDLAERILGERKSEPEP
ncbi:MAG: F0F1 ATP synthase subunit alpha [Planctomycetaceae bacterium]|nr:F0F1 ATP synthase subunit alpha [Planctomycetaceae bacterium]